jgi:tyrosine-protein kinase Etk/Wzc
MAVDEHENISSPVRKKRSNRISVLNEEFDLSLFILISQKKWKLLTGIFIVSIIISIIYLRYAQRVYEENCVIQVGSQNTANKVLSPAANIYGAGEDEVAESVELMRSRIFIEKVLRYLPMSISYYTEGTFRNNEKYLTSPYNAEVDSTAKMKLVKVPIYVYFNNLSGGKLTFSLGKGTKNSFPFNCGQWCTTPYGKININVVIPSEISKSIKNIKKDADFFLINDYNDLSKFYSRQITIKTLNSDAKTIEVSCRDEDDTKASDIANTIGKIFINEIVRKRRESDESILAFINEQMDTIYGRIRETEKTIGVGDTVRKNRFGASTQQEVLSANGSFLQSLDEKISSMEIDQKLLTDVVRKINDEPNIDPTDLIIQLSMIDEKGELKDALNLLRQYLNERQSASFDATDANTKMQELDSLIKQQKQVIYKSIDLLKEKMESAKQDIITERNDIQSKLINPGESVNLENLRLQRQASIDEKYYDMLLEKKAEYAISKAGYVPESEVLEWAIPTWIAVSPRTSVTLTIALLLATAICVLILVFIYLFYNNITSVYEIEKLTESPITILGIIPKYTKEIPASQIIVNHNPKSILAESFRSIRTNLQFIANETEAKVISITSTISGEGKTFVCVNLGGIIAYSGKRVIVLDLDMRRPRIHTAFGLDNSKGMSTLLIGKYKVEDVIQKTENDNLDIITAGPIPPNPSELVISSTMDDVLNKLKTLYDIIIVDNPPVGLVTDGIAMLQRADYPIYLMRVDYSKREFIYFVDRLYYENQFHKLSIILNGVDFKRQKYGYSYYKYGYYGYGYGYTYGHGNYYET